VTIFILVSVVIVIFVIWLDTRPQCKEKPTTHNDDESVYKTTGNDTYDFINEATGVELFDYEKEGDD